MNAFSPFGILSGDHFAHPAPVTINLTINGGVFHVGDTFNEAPQVDPNTIYVNGAGDAGLGVLPESLTLIGETIEALVASLNQPSPPWDRETEPKVRPSVGRIVHYVPTFQQALSHGAKGCPYWAALICGVFEAGDGGDIVSLLAFPPGRGPLVIDECVLEGDAETLGTWFWPAKAPRS